MHFKLLGQFAATAALATALTGCIDVSVDVAVTSTETARATMTQTMGADFYAMVKMSAESGESEEDGFCDEGTLTENADGGATCVMTEEGAFADLDLGQDEGGMTFTAAGPGLVRVALPTADMKAELGADEEMDAETKAMAEAFFTDRTLSVSVSGAEVVETNMTLSSDRKSASQAIPILDLINGTVELPEELFAVVRAP